MYPKLFTHYIDGNVVGCLVKVTGFLGNTKWISREVRWGSSETVGEWKLDGDIKTERTLRYINLKISHIEKV